MVVWWKHSIVDVLNVTELGTLKWYILCYVYFATIKNPKDPVESLHASVSSLLWSLFDKWPQRLNDLQPILYTLMTDSASLLVTDRIDRIC